MSRIPASDGDALRGPRLELGGVPDVLAALAHGPSFEALWELIRTSLNEGKFSRTTKELVALTDPTDPSAQPASPGPRRCSFWPQTQG